MRYPKFLEEGNCIGVPAPSDGSYDELKKNKFKQARKYFTSNGYIVKLSKNIYKSNRGRSASSIVRANEINKMFIDKDIDIIINAGGGDFLIEILPYVDFSLLDSNIKLVIGFSDPTGLLYTITTKYDIATIYGCNFSLFGEVPFNKNHYDFLNIIKGNIIDLNSYELYEDERTLKITGLEPSNLVKEVYWHTLDNNKVHIKGRIIGGCLDIISELCGTKYDGIKEFQERYKNDGIIWYFDNCELSMEEVLRTLWKFNELDYFKYTKGIIFGRFGVLNTYYDYDTLSMLKDSVLYKLNIPIIYDADISHKALCLPIINGSIANIKCSNGKAIIKYYLK